MFTLDVSKKDQKQVFAGLVNHEDVVMESNGKQGTFTHKSGLQVAFQGTDAGIDVTVKANPENVAEEKIKARFEDDVKLILSVA
jgi:hypothetical protein